jgi:hypothetical protein
MVVQMTPRSHGKTAYLAQPSEDDARNVTSKAEQSKQCKACDKVVEQSIGQNWLL